MFVSLVIQQTTSAKWLLSLDQFQSIQLEQFNGDVDVTAVFGQSLQIAGLASS